MKLDRHGHLAESDRVPQVAAHFHVAVPGEERPQISSHRHAVQFGVGDGDGLDQERLAPRPPLRHREQGALERQHPVAVAAGALGKQDQVVAPFETVAHLVPVRHRLAPAPLDEDRALQLGQPAVQRPACDLRLGDEGSLDQRTQGHDVDIRDVIGRVKRRMDRRLAAARLDPKTEDSAAMPVIPEWHRPLQGQVEEHGERLHRHERQRKAGVEKKSDQRLER